MEDVWSVEGYACTMVRGGDVIGDVSEVVRHVNVIVNWVGWDEVKTITAGSWRSCFRRGASGCHGGGVCDLGRHREEVGVCRFVVLPEIGHFNFRSSNYVLSSSSNNPSNKKYFVSTKTLVNQNDVVVEKEKLPMLPPTLLSGS